MHTRSPSTHKFKAVLHCIASLRPARSPEFKASPGSLVRRCPQTTKVKREIGLGVKLSGRVLVGGPEFKFRTKILKNQI